MSSACSHLRPVDVHEVGVMPRVEVVELDVTWEVAHCCSLLRISDELTRREALEALEEAFRAWLRRAAEGLERPRLRLVSPVDRAGRREVAR